MTLRVLLSARARRDIDDIWRFSRETWSQAQADAYVSGLSSAFDLLAENPRMARIRHEFHPPACLHPYRSHLIAYRHDKLHLRVVRVLNARSNWIAGIGG